VPRHKQQEHSKHSCCRHSAHKTGPGTTSKSTRPVAAPSAAHYKVLHNIKARRATRILCYDTSVVSSHEYGTLAYRFKAAN
jgi:hypothetical protein